MDMGHRVEVPAWRKDPNALRLEAGTVHVWRVPSDAVESHTLRLTAVLSDEEITHAGRFIHERDRASFARNRGLLRSLLGWYLRKEPVRIPIRQGACGKPELSGGDCLSSLRFNLSHTKGLTLFAFTREGDIGIDVERPDPSLDVERMLPWILSPEACARVRGMPRPERLAAFYAAWTLQEACAKAVGMGLGPWLDRMPDGENERREQSCGSGMWTSSLPVGPGFVAALAVRAAPPILECLDWPGDIPWFPANTAS